MEGLPTAVERLCTEGVGGCRGLTRGAKLGASPAVGIGAKQRARRQGRPVFAAEHRPQEVRSSAPPRQRTLSPTVFWLAGLADWVEWAFAGRFGGDWSWTSTR